MSTEHHEYMNFLLNKALLLLMEILHHLLQIKPSLGGGFKYFLFSPLLGEGFQFD